VSDPEQHQATSVTVSPGAFQSVLRQMSTRGTMRLTAHQRRLLSVSASGRSTVTGGATGRSTMTGRVGGRSSVTGRAEAGRAGGQARTQA
jgi:hypothetical protein